MTVAITIILTVGICYLMGHWDEIISNNRVPQDGYHTDHDAFNRDIVLKGKNEAMRRFNRGEYDVKDKK